MQAAVCFTPSFFPARLPPTISIVSSWKSNTLLQTTQYCSLIKAAATSNSEPSAVDYSSKTSVFPAEACETVGGDACDVEMYPEAKLNPEAKSNSATRASETVDREYLEYNSPKTVFPGEACDDLGGEFCNPEYQKGVY